MTEKSEDERPFLSRWSERKRAARAADAAMPEPEATVTGEAPAGEEAVLAANRAEAEAIDLDSLTDRSDYSPFLKAGVPAALKSAALRRLWRSSPVFSVPDGLSDYADDYSFPKPPAGGVKTAWKIGRGFLTGSERAADAGSGQDDAGAPPVAGSGPQPGTPAGEGGAAAEAAAHSPRAAAGRPPEEPGPPGAAEQLAAGTDSAGDLDTASTAPEPAAPAKVGLARRVDFAAFARSGDGD